MILLCQNNKMPAIKNVSKQTSRLILRNTSGGCGVSASLFVRCTIHDIRKSTDVFVYANLEMRVILSCIRSIINVYDKHADAACCHIHSPTQLILSHSHTQRHREHHHYYKYYIWKKFVFRDIQFLVRCGWTEVRTAERTETIVRCVCVCVCCVCTRRSKRRRHSFAQRTRSLCAAIRREMTAKTNFIYIHDSRYLFSMFSFLCDFSFSLF